MRRRSLLLLSLAFARGGTACSEAAPSGGPAGASSGVGPSAGQASGQGGAIGGAAPADQGGGATGSLGGASGAAAAAGMSLGGVGTGGPGGSPSSGAGSGSGGAVSTVGLAGCQLGKQLHADDFGAGLARWVAELEAPAQSTVTIQAEQLDIDAAAGATVWFAPLLQGNVLIEYDVSVVMQGGPNDHLTDLNSFWMATDPQEANLFTRSGGFAQYNDLFLYYVGFGGNANTTTRIRRYDGNATRPEPLDEYLDASHLLVANHAYHLQHIVCGKHLAYVVDGVAYFELDDPSPYTSGRFGFRTVGSHESIDNFSVRELLAP